MSIYDRNPFSLLPVCAVSASDTIHALCIEFYCEINNIILRRSCKSTNFPASAVSAVQKAIAFTACLKPPPFPCQNRYSGFALAAAYGESKKWESLLLFILQLKDHFFLCRRHWSKQVSPTSLVIQRCVKAHKTHFLQRTAICECLWYSAECICITSQWHCPYSSCRQMMDRLNASRRGETRFEKSSLESFSFFFLFLPSSTLSEKVAASKISAEKPCHARSDIVWDVFLKVPGTSANDRVTAGCAAAPVFPPFLLLFL